MKVKKDVINHYGGKCAVCGVRDIDMLTMDHIENDGAAHRREVGVSFYRWLMTHDYPKGFQVLCANHNLKKHLIWMRSRLPPLS